jgi:hypothetical protein
MRHNYAQYTQWSKTACAHTHIHTRHRWHTWLHDRDHNITTNRCPVLLPQAISPRGYTSVVRHAHEVSKHSVYIFRVCLFVYLRSKKAKQLTVSAEMRNLYHSSDKESWRQSTMGCCNVCGRNWITGLTSAASPGVDIWSTCKVWHTLGEFLYLFICSFLLCLSWLLYCRVRKFRRDLWITLYIIVIGGSLSPLSDFTVWL